MVVIRRCFNCEKEIKRAPSHIKKRVFCSRDCQREYSRKPIVCLGCGNSFPRKPKNPSQKYCSQSCFLSSHPDYVNETCVVCKKQFQSYYSESQKRLERGHVPCCSRSCRNSYTSTLLGGDGTWVEGGRYNPKRQRSYTWRKVRAKYIKTIDNTCEGCLDTEVFAVHHLYPTAAGGEMYDFDNLMGVCADCHDLMHEQLREGEFDDCLEAAKYEQNLYG